MKRYQKLIKDPIAREEEILALWKTNANVQTIPANDQGRSTGTSSTRDHRPQTGGHTSVI